MSRLWRKKLYITIAPERVEITQLGRGLRLRVIATEELSVYPELNKPNWTAPIAALQSYIEALNENYDATIVLSNHFVRYCLVPWSPDLSDAEERLAMAGICFEKVYGDASKDWIFRSSSEGFSRPSIASAVDKQLIDELKTVGINKKLNLISVQPRLMAAVNQHRKEIKEKNFWFMIAEPGNAILLQSQSGKYVGIKSLPVEAGSMAGLELAISREQAILPIAEDTQPYLFVTGFPPSEVMDSVSQKFRLLTPESAPRASQWHMLAKAGQA